MDYYRVLGIDPKLQLNLHELQQLFYGRSRELHPDRFARAEAGIRDAALQESSLLNDAYRTLKDPIQRAEYFLKNHGFDIGEQGTKDVPPELLEEVFELNMALEELKSGDESARPQLATARDHFAALLAQSDIEAGHLFAAYDAAPGESVLKQIRGLLNRRRYIQNLLRDVNGYLSN
jgi:molecular chaperone HscB